MIPPYRFAARAGDVFIVGGDNLPACRIVPDAAALRVFGPRMFDLARVEAPAGVFAGPFTTPADVYGVAAE